MFDICVYIYMEKERVFEVRVNEEVIIVDDQNDSNEMFGEIDLYGNFFFCKVIYCLYCNV